MKFILFLISGYVMGFVAAIPAGPIQIEVARRSINGYLKSSLMVILGAFIMDIIYGCIAFFGIAPFLEDRKVMAIFWLVGAMFLIALSVVIIRNNVKEQKFDPDAQHLRRKRWGFIGGLTLSGVNPMMILWWLLGVRLFTEIGLIQDFTTNIALSFLAAGGLGLATYLVLLSLFLYWAKKFISERKRKWINIVFGIGLFCIAVYFIVTSIMVIA